MLWLASLIDLKELFEPDASLIETFIRGTVTYLSIFVLLRVLLKRGAGGVNLPDLLVVVLVADAAQNGMAGDYTSITSGLLLVATVAGWAYALDLAAFHVPLIASFVHPPSIPLVTDGRAVRQNLRRELISMDELMTAVHDAGAEELTEVRLAYLEGNGEISVILEDGEPISRSKPAIG